MISIKVKFRPSAVPGAQGAIYYRITSGKTVRQITSSLRIFPAEWDTRHSIIIVGPDSPRSHELAEIRADLRADLSRIRRVADSLGSLGTAFTVDDIVERYRNYEADFSFTRIFNSAIGRLLARGRHATAENYRAALSSLLSFRNNRDLTIDSMTPELLDRYQSWQRSRGITLNTISFYNRIFRAVYNRGVAELALANGLPFKGVYTGIARTVKRAVGLDTLSAIKALDLTARPDLDYARDMFLLSFYLRGMSFVDMAYLRRTDLCGSTLIYRRRKTGRNLTIAWVDDMQRIVDKYPPNPTGHLLPVIVKTDADERKTYLARRSEINRSLKIIGRLVGCSIPLTLYVARHSWATAARAKGIPLSVISEGMGHDSEATTRIYLASLDATVVDQANQLLISALG